MTHIRLFLGFLLLCWSWFSQAENCPDKAYVEATYFVTEQLKTDVNTAQSKTGSGSKTALKPVKVRLVRDPKQVAMHYEQNQITEIWQQTRNQRLFLVRYFDQHQRGIEYQPNEIAGSHDWSLKYQLVSETLLAEMRLLKDQGEGCERLQTLEKNQNGTLIRLQWLVNRRLPQQFELHLKDRTILWRLADLHLDAKDIGRLFDRYASFQTTDYADIGDNESDPFLMKMINLGFIEHGHSGFYNSEGQAIEAAGPHQQQHHGHSH